MINLHIYPSPFTRESRILRETAVISEYCCFDRVIMVGVSAPGLPDRERVDERREIWRFPRPLSSGLIAKLWTTWLWARQVYAAFRFEPLGCVNCHSLPVFALSARLARVTGAKLVYDTHELETETNGLSGPRKWLSKLVERRLIRRADAVIVVSQSIGDWYARTYGIEPPTLVLNSPSRANIVRSRVLRDTLKISDRQRIYLYLGVLVRGRGIEILCAGFDALSQPRPALVFMGEGALEPLIRGYSARNPDIYLVPAVAPGEVLKFAASADVGLCAIESTCLSYEYCMPNKLFEYLQAGIPMICSDLPELRRLVHLDGVGMILPRLDAAAVADTVRQMEVRSLAEFAASVEIAARKYDWAEQAQTLLRLYGKLGLLR